VESLIKPSTTKWQDSELESSTEVSHEYVAYFEDIKDNISRVLDLLETYKEVCESLNNHHQEAQNTKTNDIVRTLTVVSTIFTPITFFAGVYGMNFKVLPELNWELGYLYFWTLTAGIIVIMISILKWKAVI